jgi:hypothetical protein
MVVTILTFWNDTVFDPFGTNGVGTNRISTADTAFGSPQLPLVRLRTSAQATTFAPATPPATPPATSCRRTWAASTVSYSATLLRSPSTTRESSQPDVANSQRQGCYVGGRFGDASGPLDVALAYGSSMVGDNCYAGTTTSVNTVNLGASYDFGPVKLFGQLSKARNRADYEATPFLGHRHDVDLTGWLRTYRAGWRGASSVLRSRASSTTTT